MDGDHSRWHCGALRRRWPQYAPDQPGPRKRSYRLGCVYYTRPNGEESFLREMALPHLTFSCFPHVRKGQYLERIYNRVRPDCCQRALAFAQALEVSVYPAVRGQPVCAMA